VVKKHENNRVKILAVKKVTHESGNNGGTDSAVGNPIGICRWGSERWTERIRARVLDSYVREGWDCYENVFRRDSLEVKKVRELDGSDVVGLGWEGGGTDNDEIPAAGGSSGTHDRLKRGAEKKGFSRGWRVIYNAGVGGSRWISPTKTEIFRYSAQYFSGGPWAFEPIPIAMRGALTGDEFQL
jgi:hypothetical protein